MRRYSILGLVLFSLILSVSSFAVEEPTYRDGYVLVKFDETGLSSTSKIARQSIITDAVGAASSVQKMYNIIPGLGLVKLAGTTVESAVTSFNATSGVVYAEPVYIHTLAAVPDDPYFTDLWGMNNTGQTGGEMDADIDAVEAWNITTGKSSVIVAVTDSGIDYTHPDLADNMWVNDAEYNGYPGIDDDNNGYIDDIYGIDAVNADSDPLDDNDHGTHCAGTIGAVGDNGIGVAGVCWDVQLMALKCFDQFGSGDTAAEIECIEYAIAKGAHVINASWGGFGYSQVLYDVIQRCAQSNIIFVAAAGNYSMDNDGAFPFYPASFELGNIISVASTTDSDELSSFSHYGKTSVDLAAPGSLIYSTAPGGGYQYMSGTSMAAPHVAGSCALVLSLNQGMGALEVKDVLMKSVDSLTTLKELCVSEGRLNINSALLYGGGDLVGPSPDPLAWEIEPVATGLHHIVMKAIKARDRSGAEYKFDCIEDDAFDSDWQNSQVYEVTDVPEGGTYTFRVIARDKSVNQNMNEKWSESISATTATGVDDLPPAPNPAQWLALPRVTRVSRNEIGMALVTSYDENDVEYYFDCLSTTEPGVDPNTYDSKPSDAGSPSYTVVVGDVTGQEFVFQGYVRQKNGTAYETKKTSMVTVGRAEDAVVREVPSTVYKTIQDAIDAANNGDTILVHQGLHRENNINFRGKAVTVRSENPEDPAIVAATIIDCEDIWDYWGREYRRAFLFQNGETRDSVLAGITIRNATTIDRAAIHPEWPGTAYGQYRQWDRSKIVRPDLILTYGLMSNYYLLFGTEIPHWYEDLVSNSPSADFDIAWPYYDQNIEVTDWYPDYSTNYADAEYWDGLDAFGGAMVIGDSQWMWMPSRSPIYGDVWVVNDPNNLPDPTDPNNGQYETQIVSYAYSYEAKQILMPASPTIRNCVFENCLAQGMYGDNSNDPGNQGRDIDGYHGDRGGNGGNAKGGAIYVYGNSAPLIKECEFVNCRAIGGNGGIGSNGNNGGDHSDGVDNSDGWDGGHGGDAGLAGSAWGGAIYFEPNCVPELYGVTISDCLVQVGEPGSGGNGGNGSNAKGTGDGGHGGNGGVGGDLRAPDSSGGAIYFGENTIATVDGCTFERCSVVAELSGDYSGGNGGNGGNYAGDNTVGGDGGHGGPAYYIPDKLVEIGGVDATGGTGGDGGGDGNRRGLGGNGGFRLGLPGSGSNVTGVSFESTTHTGIFPSNLYYLCYYWEDTSNLDIRQSDPNLYYNNSSTYRWEQDEESVEMRSLEDKDTGNIYQAPAFITVENVIYDGGYSPYNGVLDITTISEPNLYMDFIYENIPGWDPNTSNPSDYDPNDYWNDPNVRVPTFYYLPDEVSADVYALSTINSFMPNTGACAGAVYYGENSLITAAHNTSIGNRSFANHGGADLFDRGCTATLTDCVYEDNDTRYEMEVDADVDYPEGRIYENNYKFEGYGGALFFDQPVLVDCNDCTFTDNGAYSGGAIYCNFAPSGPGYQPTLGLDRSIFSGNRADSHFMYSVGGAVYAGNSFYPYEEYYFNNFGSPLYHGMFYGVMTSQFITSTYIDHGFVDFDYVLNTDLWHDWLEADRILAANGGLIPQKTPNYYIPVTDCIFEDNVAPYGGGLAIDASIVNVADSEFTANAAQYGAGGYLFATDATIKGSRFHKNIGEEIESLGYLSQIGNLNVDALATGAGLYVLDSDVFLANNRFAANEVNGYAGALFINGPSVSLYPQSVINNLFVENAAGIAGGAFASAGLSDVEMMNCTYVDNYVSDVVSGYGGAILAHDTYINVTNTIFWDNDAVWGPQLCVGDPYEEVQGYDPSYIPYTTVAVYNSDVQGGEYDVYIDWNGYPWLEYGYDYRDPVDDKWKNSNNNLADDPETTKIDEADPKFIQISDPNEAVDRQFYLWEADAQQWLETDPNLKFDSPCKNAGIPSITIYDPDFGDWIYQPDVTIWLKQKLGSYTTTRTDLEPDADFPNMGFHFDSRDPVVDYALTTSVYIADHYAHGTISPVYNNEMLKQGTVVKLTAVPDEGYRVKRWYNTDEDSLAGEVNETVVNYITMSGDREVQVEFELGVPKNLYVPEGYETIEEAVQAARSGDRIVLAPRVNQPYTITNPEGIHFGNKTLTVMSQDPDDPAIVAATIVDCQGSRYQSKRAFMFDAPDADPNYPSSIEGITIKNGFTAGAIGLSGVLETGPWPPVDDAPDRAPSGMDAAGNGFGGAILCEKGSSPLIRNCIFEDCLVAGGIGGDGMSGYYQGNDPPEGDWDGVSGGHSGNGIGNGYGGAIAIVDGGKPKIIGCQFINNIATGGWGGISGDGGDAGGNGRNSWGGDSGYGEGDGRGGAIYVEANCDPILHNNVFKGNEARTGYVSSGGQFGTGNAYPDPWDWSDEARMGSNGYLRSYGTVAGGAVFYGEEAISELYNSEFEGNRAFLGQFTSIEYDYYTQEIELWDFTRGGAVYADPNVTLDVYGCIFDGNIGGAVYMSAGATPSFQLCDFTGNLTSDPDHEDYNTDLSYMVQDYTGIEAEVGAENLSTFVTPSAGISIEVDAKTTVVVEDCTFVANVTEGKGGAIRSESSLNIWDSLFASNTAVENGGAIYAYYHVDDPNTHTLLVDVDECQFNKNASTALGGGGYMKNCILTFDDCQFTDNVANSGGALQTAECELTMLESLLYNNEATGYIEGHKVVVEEGFGGALSLADTETAIENTRILNNRALSANATGGGICFTGGQYIYDQVLRNCVIAGNSSDNIGGGIACKINADVVLNTCTIADNTAVHYGGGLYVDQISHPVVIDSIIAGNKAAEGGGIYEKPTNGMGQTDVSYTLFYQNTGGDLYDAQKDAIYSGKADLEDYAGYANIYVGDPRFEAGPLGSYYLDQNSSAATSGRSGLLILTDYTTDPTDPYYGTVQKDVGNDDLGYHYRVPDTETERYLLTAAVSKAGHGQVTLSPDTPDSNYYHGAIVTCTANVASDYYLTSWSGGTSDDSSRKAENYVIMTSAKDITANIRLRETFYVGGAGVYQEVQSAVDDARDGDIVLIAPGVYNPGVGAGGAGEYYGDLVTIQLDGKILQIIGSYPEDESGIRSTVLENYQFYLNDMPEECLIEGITLRSGDMDIYGGNPTIRNCIFSENRWSGGDGLTFNGCALDGSDAGSVLGGAITILEASPTFINCIFEDNMAAGGTGGNGTNGCTDHPSGGDGGWPGRGYGGAVYIGFSSHPTFEHCTFSGNEANGGLGGNGGEGATIGGYKYHGGRGGGFEWPDSIEDDPLTWVWDDGWDGWTYGDKYDFYALLYNQYDWDKWTKWFEWGDRFENWADFLQAYGITYTVDDDGFLVASIEAIEEDPFDKYDPYWQYSGYGGAVYCGYDSSAEFEDCVFTQNTTTGSLSGVGGDRWETPDRQINLPNAGAAVYAANDSMLTFKNCDFDQNVADTSTVDIPYSFDISFGGAVAYEYDCQVTFDGCDFASNQATVGGSIYARDSYTEIVDCNVFDSEAYLGGGVYLEKGANEYDDPFGIDAVISGTIIHKNRAARPEVVIEEPEDPDDPDAPVIPAATLDSTGVGGGLFAVSTDLVMRDIAFVGNSADMSGGGLMLTGTVAGPTNIFNGLFAENRASRDGGGASVNWSSRVAFDNCTFADNRSLGVFDFVETGEFTEVVIDEQTGDTELVPIYESVQVYDGSGGGLYCAYNSVVDVSDSIFWANLADEGSQITVGTGFEFDPRPAKLTIAYSSVDDYPSANAIYQAPGSTADTSLDVVEREPEFERRPGARAGEHYWNYYLRQADSAEGDKSECIDQGSVFASVRGLSDYTTSIYGARDKGMVDLGYHYERISQTSCSLADFEPSGTIDLADWSDFAYAWWFYDSCDEGNGWCGGVDLDFNTELNVNDLTLFTGCWLAEDDLPPAPNPVTWVFEPNAPVGTFDILNMMATEVHDDWWSDDYIEYKFVCLNDPTRSSGAPGNGLEWRSERFYEVDNLEPIEYEFFIYARDGSLIETSFSAAGTGYGTPGDNTEIPDAIWGLEPYNTVINPGPNAEIAVGMEARAYEDFAGVPTLPTGYSVKYQFIRDNDLNALYQNSNEATDTDIVDGATYTYTVRMGLFHTSSANPIKEYGFSEPIEILVEGADLQPPLPDPAMHAVGSPADVQIPANSGIHYVIVESVEATDMPEDSTYGVEYMFVCSDGQYSSGTTGNGPLWRNDDNVGPLGVDADPADYYYDNGQPQDPERYLARTNLERPNLTWTIYCRDRSPNQNAAEPSEPHSINDPQTEEVAAP